MEMEKKRKLEEKIRKQVACEEKAFRIVERLIENPISEEFLIDSCNFITPQHYEDIVEERAITKTCGYPICSKPLTLTCKQKYRISTRENKVYDITERKSFCSDLCFKASRHLLHQISTSPLWTRDDKEHIIPVSLLSTKSGLAGIEVVGPIEKIRKEVNHLNKLDSFEKKVKDNTLEEKVNLASDRLSEISLTRPDAERNQPKKTSDTSNNKVDEKMLKHFSSQASDSNGNLEDKKEKDLFENRTCSKIDSDDEHFDGKDFEEQVLSKELSSVSITESKNQYDKQNEKGHYKVIVEKDGDGMGKGDNLKTTSEGHDKMQHLMKLLDRRKELLSQLTKMETVPKNISDMPEKKPGEKSLLSNDDQEKAKSEVLSGWSETVSHENTQKDFHIKTEQLKVEKATKNNTTIEKIPSNEKIEVHMPENNEKYTTKNILENSKVSSQSVIQILCQSMKSWITTETIQFLQMTKEQDPTGVNRARTDFEAMYQALCRRVDAGEFEIEDIGVESKLEDIGVESKLEDVRHQAIPAYQTLKEETGKFSVKVKQFFAGELHTEPVEKDSKEHIPVHLPTVDTYDQMQIRRKIVMERLQKVITGVLSPLKLTIQDIYTDYKELITTFRLDSKNITYKPAEWTIINLIILRMLSRKNQKLRTAFLQPSSVTYFKILLGKLGTNLQQIDVFIDDLLIIC